MKPTKSLCICLVCVCVHAVVHAINFSPAFDINNDPAKIGYGSQVALNSTGTAIAVWYEMNGGVNNIFARTFDGTNWSLTADNLSSDTSRSAFSPQVALNSTGTAIAVWYEMNGGVNNIFTRIFDGTNWSLTATNLNNDTAYDSQLPQISLNSTGTAIAVWHEQVGVYIYNVFARIFDGTNWSLTATNLNNDTSRLACYPQISLNSTGTAIAVWQEDVESVGSNIFACTFDGTNWSTVVNLNNDISKDAQQPAISLNSTGTAIAVWLEYNGGVYNIFARTFDGINWSDAVNLNNNTSANAASRHIALNDDGTAIVAWSEDKGIVSNIFVRTFDGTHWSDAVNCNNTFFNIAGEPNIALNDDGTAIVVWGEFDGSLIHVFARHTVLPYYFTQWLSSCDGNKQYIAAVTYNETLNKNCVDIYEFLPNNNGIDFKTSITFESTTTVNSFAVYNKSDTELYLAILGKELLQIWKFDGTSTTLEKDLSQAGHTYHDAQWWVSESHDRYIAAIDDTHLTVFDLSHSTTYTIAASGNKLLWTTKDAYRGVAVVDTSSVIPYQIDFSPSLTIAAGTGATVPTGFEFESISTCEDYIAVGLTSTDTTAYGYAQIHILDLDSNNNTLAFSGTSTTLAGQIAVPSLARCCCCSTLCHLLAGSYDTNRNYTISVLAPDLSAMYASTLLGNNVNSVGWSCQDKSIYFTAAGHETINDFIYTVKYTCSVDGNTIIEPVVLNRL